MPEKKWDVKTIRRSAQTAEAQLKRAKESGFEVFEANQAFYKLKRPWAQAAQPEAGVEEHPAPDQPADDDQ